MCKLKQNDLFQVENEEMVCDNSPIDYGSLDDFSANITTWILG